MCRRQEFSASSRAISRGESFKKGGFSLIECLVALTVVGVLATALFALLQTVQASASNAACASTLRQLGIATHLYANEHGGTFPRSWHSAGAHREPGWAVSIAPYLGLSAHDVGTNWADAFNRHFRCPSDEQDDPYIFSYGLNVYFELSAMEDYPGSPQTWRTLQSVEHPSRTILMAHIRPIRFGDHFMCHQWNYIAAAENAVNHTLHSGRSNYLFVDGSVDSLSLSETFNPDSGINRWHP